MTHRDKSTTPTIPPAVPPLGGRPTNNSQAASIANSEYLTAPLKLAGRTTKKVTLEEGDGPSKTRDNSVQQEKPATEPVRSGPPSSPRRAHSALPKGNQTEPDRGERDPGRSMNTTSDYGDIFKGEIPLEGLDIVNEPLSWSLKRDHAVFNPAVDADPLVAFGGRDGVLPGTSVEDSALFRDVLLRWTTPHAKCYWNSLEEGAKRFVETKFQLTDVLKFRSDLGQTTYYHLLPGFLNSLGAMLVALNQVFQGLSEFLREDSAVAFTVDVNYNMLRMLCWHTSDATIVLTTKLLQISVENGVKHIKHRLNR